MTAPEGGPSRERPVLFRRAAEVRSIPPRRGGGGRVEFRNREQRLARLNERFEAALADFGAEVQLQASLQAADPQLVLVFEALDEQIDLSAVAGRLGLEIVGESEGAVEQTEDYVLTAKNPRSPLIGSCLHAVCMNRQTFDNLRSLWASWRADQPLQRGLSPVRDLFAHLKDVRPWGPQDRLKAIGWEQYFAEQIADQHTVEIELWYRLSPNTRAEAQRAVESLVTSAGGTVDGAVVIEAIGYHGLSCRIPTSVLTSLAQQQYDQVQLVRSANVMYLRITGQASLAAGPVTEVDVQVTAPAPTGAPILCLFDGVPASNHPLLAGRVEVVDPDDLTSDAPAAERRHGTAMASVAVWGDRSAALPPAERVVLVRPILVPSPETQARVEELPAGELAPDLMWRAFRDLFEGRDGNPAAAPQIAVVNLSVGDPAMPYETTLSAWARMIDWLSYHYGVLVVVAAGNHHTLDLAGIDSTQLLAFNGHDRRAAILAAQDAHRNQRRILSPAESINALTVGALHHDESGASPVGYTADPTDGLPSLSPVSGLGPGYRRSIKPDLAAVGGRSMMRTPSTPEPGITFTSGSPLGPGLKVAEPVTSRETYLAGTSGSAALASRYAAQLHDLVDQITAGDSLTRRQGAAAIKALLVHSTATSLDGFDVLRAVDFGVGNGFLIRNLSDGCASNEAVALFVGTIGALQEQDLAFPLPDGLSVREVKRIEATLAWLSPINWRHRQYRRAALSFVKPAGAIPGLGTPTGLSSDDASRGATTVQHQVWETQSAFASGRGSEFTVRVKCYEQAGGLGGETIDYAAALSLWVAPTIGVDVYTQVRDQVRPGIAILPR